jgi:glycosyltransferase involved in cell wall biosynthesis
MKVLHLFSDWKWTGPAEPTVSLCEALSGEGLDVILAFRKTPIDFPERTVGKEAARRSIPVTDRFRLNRYFSPRDWWYDLRAIKAYVRKHGVDIVHANLSHDHFTALFSLGFTREGPVLVRTDHKRDGMPQSPFMSWAMKRTDGLVTYSRRIMEQDYRTFSFPPERSCVIPPGIQFYNGPVHDLRSELGIAAGEKVIGVIGRLKPDRGYDVILKGFKLLRERMGGVKLVIVGRSSQIEKSIMEPISELGIAEDVVLAGYRIDDYFSMISTFDIFVMMRAGSDGSARALREVLALGRPAIVSDMGMLPELVEDGKSGFVVPPDPTGVSAKMESLLASEELRRDFGLHAARFAREHWSYRAQARSLIGFYERLLFTGSEGAPGWR